MGEVQQQARRSLEVKAGKDSYFERAARDQHCCVLSEFSAALHPQGPSGLLGTGSPGRPPRLSHTSSALEWSKDLVVSCNRFTGLFVDLFKYCEWSETMIPFSLFVAYVGAGYTSEPLQPFNICRIRLWWSSGLQQLHHQQRQQQQQFFRGPDWPEPQRWCPGGWCSAGATVQQHCTSSPGFWGRGGQRPQWALLRDQRKQVSNWILSVSLFKCSTYNAMGFKGAVQCKELLRERLMNSH